MGSGLGSFGLTQTLPSEPDPRNEKHQPIYKHSLHKSIYLPDRVDLVVGGGLLSSRLFETGVVADGDQGFLVTFLIGLLLA